jgi:hypothetical protein
MRPHLMEVTFLLFKNTLCVVSEEIIQADIVQSVFFFASYLSFVNRSERQQVLYKRPIRSYRN